ncbi:cytosolic phospholipase A2 delta-like [Tachysurus vachellii]|uniref:cytosolic phospholipase A2 delta-like n=1 Tax=Tachysurus vachellii TaxID=175792 RepID=UPI00296B2EEE|nr:cytosolic phospholipase A2 delta-like [Tachysurus vachellii]
MKKELAPHWNLSVTVLRGHFEHSYDYLSPPDLYVTLRLPTASACTLRTKIINNSISPEWNETFTFRTNSQVKNILELDLYDGDIVWDEECARILFDISTLQLGQKETKVFITNDAKKDKLWVEFELTESSEAPAQYISNGVLLASPLSTLEVKLDKLPVNFQKDMLLKLQGAYNEKQVISLSKNSSFMQVLRYHINKSLETKIELQTDSESTTEASVTPFASTSEITLSLPVAEDKVNLHLNTVDSSEEDMKVRLDFDIPAEEKAFLVKRREVVSRALQKYFNLETPLEPTQVPTVALVCSGGSSRAMTGVYGFLKGLQSLDLLDAVTYITAVSGSTWATASLYSEPFWSKEGLAKVIASSQKELSKNKASLFSPKQLYYYRSELQDREKEGHPVSFIDTWGLIIEHLIFGKKCTDTLSDQKKAVSEGQNPLPIYTAVNMKKDSTGCSVPEWCEFTPYEVGFSKYGAFVPVEHFGSGFYLGHVVKKLPETRLTFLLGVWSSFFSANLLKLWSLYTGGIPAWATRLGDKVDTIERNTKSTNLDTLRIRPEASRLNSFLNDCPIISSVFNFLRGFALHNLYRESPEFNTSNDTHPDAFPNKLTPVDSTLRLVDSGFGINTAFSPVLRAHRCADVILCLDYSWAEDQLMTLKETQQYCIEHKLPFPKIDFSQYKSQPKREVYVFEDEKNPDAPIVIHFPLVNISFKEYKAPGVKRNGKTELQEGNIDVSSSSSPYATQNITFEPEDFRRLVDLTSYNIVNNRASIRSSLKKALIKKGLSNIPSEETTSSCVIA